MKHPVTPLDLMKALADDTRLTSMILLLDGPLCVCDLMDALALSQPKVSRHLAVLRDAGLVTSERKEQWVYYSVAGNLPLWATNTLAELRTPIRRAFASSAFPVLEGEQPRCC